MARYPRQRPPGDPGRRRLLGVLAAALAGAPFAVRGQAARPARIGWMAGVSYATTSHWPVFVGAMQALGWREGRDYVVEHAPSEGRAERFPAIAADLVQRRVDAIIAAGTPPSLAARDATRAVPVPVVFFFVGDPVGSGLVASLARPGGNLTGLGGLGAGLHAKQLELLKEAVPAVRRVAIFHNPEFPLHDNLSARDRAGCRRASASSWCRSTCAPSRTWTRRSRPWRATRSRPCSSSASRSCSGWASGSRSSP